jgi:hypothetical protein
MVHLLTLALFASSPAARALGACTEPPRPGDQNRYEDFYRLRREADQRAERIEHAATEVHGRGRERAEKLEAARLEYVRTRRVKPDTDQAEATWREQIVQRNAKNEAARECFVSTRGKGSRGREIPDAVEYRLDE